MKQAKKPTRSQRELIGRKGFDTFDWLVVSETNSYLKIIKKGKTSEKDVVTLEKQR